MSGRIFYSMAAIFLIVFFLTGCMPMGMHRNTSLVKPILSGFSSEVKEVNTSQIIEEMVKEAVSELSADDFNIRSIAVWIIKSQTAGLNVELIRQTLIAELVSINQYQVLSRQRLADLLAEQELSLSGAISDKSAVEIGELIGVDGFIDGFVAIDDNRVVLNLSLIETKSGIIVWAKTYRRSIKS